MKERSIADAGKNTVVKKLIILFVGLSIAFVLWEIAIRQSLSVNSNLPSPIQVFNALLSMWRGGELREDIMASLGRIFTGFVIALFIAIILGVMAARFTLLFGLVKTPMDILSSIPPIAWTPLAILWFGIGNAPAYFIVFLGSFFPMFVSVYAGVSKVDREYIEAAQTLGASPTLLVRKVIFPASFPQIFTGIQTGIAVAWFNVIAAELIGVRSGLGYKIQLYRTLLAVENVVALMFVIGTLGLLMTRLTRSVGKLIAPWAIQDKTKYRWIKIQGYAQNIILPLSGIFSSLHNLKSRAQTDESLKVPVQSISSAAPLLEVDKVSLSFDAQNPNNKLKVLEEISFDVVEGEVLSIIGSNGSGKTTILKLISGLLRADSGEIRFTGKKVKASDDQITLVFQSFALFPWMTCKKNIEFALAASGGHGFNSQTREKMVDALLGDVGLDTFANTYPSDLSGGMKQRLAIARALATSPRLLLLDEAFSSLDPLNRDKSQEYVLELLTRRSVTVLSVTHDLDEAIFMSDRVLVLTPRPSRVKKIVEIKLPRPRRVECRQTKDFQEIRACLWNALHT